MDLFRCAITNFTNITVSDLQDLTKLKDTEVYFAGIVKSAEMGKNKNGKPYAKFQIEDENSSYDFFLSGNTYVEFSNYCKPNLYILVKAEVKENTWKQQAGEEPQLRLYIKKIELLENILNNYVEGLSLYFDVDKLTEIAVNDLKKLCESAKGKTPLSICVVDNQNQDIVLKMKSKKYKIGVEEFIEQMSLSPISQNIISYNLNKRAF